LCLDVEILGESGEEIELKEEDEDIFKTAEELGLNLGVEDESVAEMNTVDALEELLESDISALDLAGLAEPGADLTTDEGE
jgi:hypothetical protein